MSWVHNVGKIDDFSCFDSSSANMKMVSNVGKRIQSSHYDSQDNSFNEDNFFVRKRNNNQEDEGERVAEAQDDYNVEDGNRLSIVWHTRSSLYESSVVWKMNIFVKNLPDYFTDKNLHDLFSRYGSIAACRVARGKDGYVLPSGIGYVHFANYRAASNALIRAGEIFVNEKRIVVCPIFSVLGNDGKVILHNSGGTLLLVDDLPGYVSSPVLRDIFEGFGKLLDWGLLTGNNHANLPSFSEIQSAYVVFERASDALRAFNSMDGRSMGGQTVSVERPEENQWIEYISTVDIACALQQQPFINTAGAVLSLTETEIVDEDVSIEVSGRSRAMDLIQDLIRHKHDAVVLEALAGIKALIAKHPLHTLFFLKERPHMVGDFLPHVISTNELVRKKAADLLSSMASDSYPLWKMMLDHCGMKQLQECCQSHLSVIRDASHKALMLLEESMKLARQWEPVDESPFSSPSRSTTSIKFMPSEGTAFNREGAMRARKIAANLQSDHRDLGSVPKSPKPQSPIKQSKKILEDQSKAQQAQSRLAKEREQRQAVREKKVDQRIKSYGKFPAKKKGGKKGDPEMEEKQRLQFILVKPPWDWSRSEVVTWVNWLTGVEFYAVAFDRMKIDGRMLLRITEDDLKHDIGIAVRLHRLRLLDEVDVMKKKYNIRKDVPDVNDDANTFFDKSDSDPIDRIAGLERQLKMALDKVHFLEAVVQNNGQSNKQVAKEFFADQKTADKKITKQFFAESSQSKGVDKEDAKQFFSESIQAKANEKQDAKQFFAESSQPARSSPKKASEQFFSESNQPLKPPEKQVAKQFFAESTQPKTNEKQDAKQFFSESSQSKLSSPKKLQAPQPMEIDSSDSENEITLAPVSKRTSDMQSVVPKKKELGFFEAPKTGGSQVRSGSDSAFFESHSRVKAESSLEKRASSQREVQSSSSFFEKPSLQKSSASFFGK